MRSTRSALLALAILGGLAGCWRGGAPADAPAVGLPDAGSAVVGAGGEVPDAGQPTAPPPGDPPDASPVVDGSLDCEDAPDAAPLGSPDAPGVASALGGARACTFELPARRLWEGERSNPAAADLDGDGLPDLAVVAGADAGSLLVFRHPARGFGAPDTYPLPATAVGPALLAAGDVNGDGKPDLVVEVSQGRPTTDLIAATYLGDGRGGFGPPVTSAIASSWLTGPNHVRVPPALLDVDGDGHLDLVSTSATLLGDGQGHFTLAADSGLYVVNYVAGRFDGRPEVVTLFNDCATCPYQPHLLGWSPDGGWVDTRGPVAAGGQLDPTPLAAADLDGDRHLDLVFLGSHGPVVAWGDGAGGFVEQALPQVSMPGVSMIQAADVDGDGRLDLVVGSGGASGLVTLLGTGQRGFRLGDTFTGPLVPAPGWASVQGPLLADFDGDGRADLLLDQAGAVELALADGRGGFGRSPSQPFEAPFGPVLGDFRNDGREELILQRSSLLALGADGGLAPLDPDGGLGVFEPKAAADFDRDGNLDLLGFRPPDSGGAALVVLRGDGHGHFSAGPAVPVPSVSYTIYAFRVGDLNGDGYSDVVLSANSEGAVYVLLNDGRGGLRPPVAYAAGTGLRGAGSHGSGGPELVGLADFDADGRLDVAAWNWMDQRLYLFAGRGDGTLGCPRAVPAPVFSLAAADFDHDGYADLVAVGVGGSLALYRGGPGGFGAPALLGPVPANTVTSVVAADFDGDGNPDAAVRSFFSTTLFFGDGRGHFSRAPELPFEGQGVLVAGDLRGDGHRELVLGGNYADAVTVVSGLACH